MMFAVAWLALAIGLGDARAQDMRPPASAGANIHETLVMPFENPEINPKLYWLGEGSAVLLGELLERYGAKTVAREERIQAFEQLQLPPAAALSHATMIKIGQFVRAADVVIGTYELAGDHLTLRARVIRLDVARMTPDVIERGPLSDLFGIFDRVARRIRASPAAAPPAATGTVLASPSAFELYVKGLIAESPATQRTFLEQAAKTAPSEDRIRLALWQVHHDAGNNAQALAVAAAVPSNSLHSRAARYLLARSQLELKRFDEAFATLRALQSETRSAELLNALGVIQLRRGATEKTGRAVFYFNQATQIDPNDPDYFFNLGYGYWLDKDPPAAVYWLREAVRRNPTDGDAHLVLAASLQQTGAVTEAARERELAQRLSPLSPSTAADPVPRGLERLKPYLDRRANRVESMITAAGQRDQHELAAFHLDAARRAYGREADREAERELRRALYLSPYLADAHLLLGRVYLRNGRIGDAIQAFKVSLWSEESARGHVALAEAHVAAQNIAAAREELDRALQLDPSSTEARSLRAKIAQ